MRARLPLLAAIACGAALLPSTALGATSTAPAAVKVTDTETVQVYANASGKIDTQRVYEQLTLVGHGPVSVANPVSTDDLRNLDGFGGFSVKDGRQLVSTDVDGEKAIRTVSTNTAALPLTLAASYTLDGKAVSPGDVVGKSGHLVVTYHVQNVTGVPTAIKVKDGKGGTVTKTETVPIPMVATLTTTAPASFRNVTSSDANMGGDGHGGTQLSFTLTLIPPIGSDQATVSYAADITDGVVPGAEMQGLPVDPLTNLSFKGGAASYKSGADSGLQLTSGALQIDSNLLKLHDGAGQLLDGLIQLHDGAGQLSTGLSGSAAPGAKKLAHGTQQLKGGAGQLSDGLHQLKSKVPQLRSGVDQLAAGQKKLAGGLTQLYDGVNALPGQVDHTLAGDATYQTLLSYASSLAKDLGTINTQLGDARSSLTGIDASGLSAADQAALTAAKGDVNGARLLAGNEAPNAQQVSEGIPLLVDTLTGQIRSQLLAPIGTPTKGCNPTKTLRCAASALADGGQQLKAAAPQLSSGVQKLTAGGDQLSSGAEQLNDGAQQLATGLGTAASGAGQLDDGLGTAASGAPQIVKGSKELSTKGTKKVVASGSQTAIDYGVMYGELEAGAKRVHADAMAYGAPNGATGVTAYDYILVGDDGLGGRDLDRGLLAGGALVVGVGGWLVRRRLRGRAMAA